MFFREKPPDHTYCRGTCRYQQAIVNSYSVQCCGFRNNSMRDTLVSFLYFRRGKSGPEKVNNCSRLQIGAVGIRVLITTLHALLYFRRCHGMCIKLYNWAFLSSVLPTSQSVPHITSSLQKQRLVLIFTKLATPFSIFPMFHLV